MKDIEVETRPIPRLVGWYWVMMERGVEKTYCGQGTLAACRIIARGLKREHRDVTIHLLQEVEVVESRVVPIEPEDD